MILLHDLKEEEDVFDWKSSLLINDDFFQRVRDQMEAYQRSLELNRRSMGSLYTATTTITTNISNDITSFTIDSD